MDPKKANELVLVFDENLLYGFQNLFSQIEPKTIIKKNVFSDNSDHQWFSVCMSRSYFMPRSRVEVNSSYKQIIPYIVLRCADKCFTYLRAGSEGRLTGKYSIGIGGHLNPKDYLGVLSDVPMNGAKREFWEELFIEKPIISDHMWIDAGFRSNPYYLYDPRDSVGQVHFGLVYLINVSPDLSERIRLLEEGEVVGWKSKEELQGLGDELEGWSRLVVDACL